MHATVKKKFCRLTDCREEHDDEASEHRDAVADPVMLIPLSNETVSFPSHENVSLVCQRPHDGIGDELHDGLRREHDPDLDVLLHQLFVLLALAGALSADLGPRSRRLPDSVAIVQERKMIRELIMTLETVDV